MRTEEPIVELRDIRKTFTAHGRVVHALNGVTVRLHAHETLGIVGESGSGKSTLGRIAVGLETPDAGTVSVRGVEMSELPEGKRRVHQGICQMVFQDPYSSLNPRLTVFRQIAEALRACGIRNRREARQEATELFELVGLDLHHVDRYPHQFSGGQRQRIAIARALAAKPSVIVADEPVSALDVTIQARILKLLGKLQSTYGLAFMFISHDMAVVAHLSQRIVVMYKGRIVEFGRTADVILAPQHPYTRSLLAAVPDLDRRRDGKQRAKAAFPEHTDQDRFVAVSAEHSYLATG